MKMPRCLNMTPFKLVYRLWNFGGTCGLRLQFSQRGNFAL